MPATDQRRFWMVRQEQKPLPAPRRQDELVPSAVSGGNQVRSAFNAAYAYAYAFVRTVQSHVDVGAADLVFRGDA